jgi:hypothetical protein
MKSKT